MSSNFLCVTCTNELDKLPIYHHAMLQSKIICCQCFGDIFADQGCRPYYLCPTNNCSKRITSYTYTKFMEICGREFHKTQDIIYIKLPNQKQEILFGSFLIMAKKNPQLTTIC